MKKKSKTIVAISLAIICFLSVSLFSVTQRQPKKMSDLEIDNLQKLCKVWGYVKYTHPAFLQGKKDWDPELLGLIPFIRTAQNENEVNEILYNWFIGLGDSDYDTDFLDLEWVNAPKENKYVQADTSWVSDSTYLGKSLSDALLKMKEVPVIYKKNEPVIFGKYRVPYFPHEKSYEDMDYADIKYRLLGLFRFWNAVEYYYPYLNILDDNWNALLKEHIAMMVEGTDKQSYELAIASLSAKMHDAHVSLIDPEAYENEFGQYSAPVYLTIAEKQLVVGRIHKDYKDTCSLLQGDALLKIDGVKIEDIIEHRKKYLSVPNSEKLLNTIGHYLLRSHDEIMNVTVLRNDEELTVEIQGVNEFFRPFRFIEVNESYELLEGSIGLINPSKFSFDETDKIMNAFADTEGLIIDLRQYPLDDIGYAFAQYLFDLSIPYAASSMPSITVPGIFISDKPQYTNSSTDLSYKKPVVILMDETTQSAGEHDVLNLRQAANVTIMGQNSVGANGPVTYIALPGGNFIQFTSRAIYTPEGGQTQRIGLAPDIYIERTIAGVRDGRDEFIEAAIKFIRNNN